MLLSCCCDIGGMVASSPQLIHMYIVCVSCHPEVSKPVVDQPPRETILSTEVSTTHHVLVLLASVIVAFSMCYLYTQCHACIYTLVYPFEGFFRYLYTLSFIFRLWTSQLMKRPYSQTVRTVVWWAWLVF